MTHDHISFSVFALVTCCDAACCNTTEHPGSSLVRSHYRLHTHTEKCQQLDHSAHLGDHLLFNLDAAFFARRHVQRRDVTPGFLVN